MNVKATVLVWYRPGDYSSCEVLLTAVCAASDVHVQMTPHPLSSLALSDQSRQIVIPETGPVCKG